MCKLSESIRHTRTQDGGVLLDIRHGQMFSLNIVGAKIFELLERGLDEGQIADQVSRAYSIDLETVRTDVREFFEVLEKQHLLETRNGDAFHQGLPHR